MTQLLSFAYRIPFVLRSLEDKRCRIVSLVPGVSCQIPRVLFSAQAPRLHDLLRAWKGVRLCLDAACTEVQHRLRSQDRTLRVRPIYDLELNDYQSDYCDLGKHWLAEGPLHSLQIVGFQLETLSLDRYACSLDLSFLEIQTSDGPVHRLPDNFDYSGLRVAALAAIGVNDCVRELFDIGYILCPAEFFYRWAIFHPDKPLPCGGETIWI